MASEKAENCVVTDADAEARIQVSYRLPDRRRLRVLFDGGPGDVAGTFNHWLDGQFDPRTPVIAYSTQFYSLAERIGADALILSVPDSPTKGQHPRFRFLRVSRAWGSGPLGYRLRRAHFGRTVLRHIQAFDPDVVVLGTDVPLFVIWGLPRRTRVILSVHNTFWPMGRRPASLRERLKQSMTALSLRRISAAVCTSPECRNQIIELTGNNRNLFVESPQILQRFAGSHRERTTVRNLLFLGRTEVGKGILDLVDAFEEIARDHPVIRLQLAGTGSADDLLRTRISRSPFAERIEILGQLSSEEVHRALDRSDLLVCPTRSEFPEGLALVVVEAAVHGVPTVLSSVVPAKEVVPGGSVEFPADDTAALEQALRGLIESPARYQSLCRSLRGQSGHFFDRSRSWGSQLYQAFFCEART